MKLKGTGVLIKYMVIHDLSSFFPKVGISIFTLLSLILLRLAAELLNTLKSVRRT